MTGWRHGSRWSWRTVAPGWPGVLDVGALGSDDPDWARGQAWAFAQAMGLVWYYLDTNPAMAGLGRRTLDRILAATARSGPG